MTQMILNKNKKMINKCNKLKLILNIFKSNPSNNNKVHLILNFNNNNKYSNNNNNNNNKFSFYPLFMYLNIN